MINEFFINPDAIVVRGEDRYRVSFNEYFKMRVSGLSDRENTDLTNSIKNSLIWVDSQGYVNHMGVNYQMGDYDKTNKAGDAFYDLLSEIKQQARIFGIGGVK